MKRDDALARFDKRMEDDGLPPAAREAFHRMYSAYRRGNSGRIPWEAIGRPEQGDLVSLAELEAKNLTKTGESFLGRLVWIVLNGGLGTSMNMVRAKSLLPVKGSSTFLDLTVRHVLRLRRRYGEPVPLLFMNSFATREDTLRALQLYDSELTGQGQGCLPLDFVQHRFPRIREDDGLPFGDPAGKDAWAPPGHGNLYLALHGSGLLNELLRQGFRWAFVSNADNLGASPHPGVLAYMAEEGMEFLMEVTRKTAADVKGGTLVRRQGRLELLEIAQVPENHAKDFQDANAFPVFNTNNLWVDLDALRIRLDRGPLDLPLIVNRKRAGDTAVVQLETAMGAAIGAFSESAGVLVPRKRFAPVKTTDDLLVRRSDAYVLGEESPLEPNPEREDALGPLVVALDRVYYRSVQDLDFRIPAPPSLFKAVRFEVVGDVRFGKGVVVEGSVQLVNRGPAPMDIRDGTVLSG